ncbi:MAG TPA: NF038129 family PEP-CTERM protein [Bryobacteraceae bacterium]|nr:NF038129 family PEP-CTERM protein [Bryobacteraceae bacterium]
MKNTIRIGAILLLGTAPFLRADMSFQVTVDTTPLAGVAGYMAFDLFGGVPLQDNVSTITSFATTGTLLAGASTSGDVSGSLTPGPLVETADMDFNEWLQPITFGSGLTTFDVDLTTSYIPLSTPDSFSFTLLDNTFTPFATSDPLGADRLFAIDLVGADTTPDVFTSSFATATVTASGSAVPEPNLLPLAFLGFGLMLAVHAIVRRARIARS